MTEALIDSIKVAANKLHEQLLVQRNSKGVWDGRLSSSALAVAVATFSIWKYDALKNSTLIFNGLKWLKTNQNKDGGFGDTPQSKSNLSTSLLCWSALSITMDDTVFDECNTNLENYLLSQTSSLEPSNISQAILKHYANDRTFSVPILAMCALAGRLGENGWKYVPQLPHQLAILPNNLFRWLNLSVVSYAIPALISMGLVKQKMTPSKNPLMRWVNRIIEPKLLCVLLKKQPPNGGFLEAIPLTGFVLMTLIGAGFRANKICLQAELFLQQSVRNDGSWPIDTSLTTWVSTLAINALHNDQLEQLNSIDKNKISQWLFNQQHKTIHPFTKTPPGGWAWIDSPGGVADGDDTSGALIALKRLVGASNEGKNSAKNGLTWLLGIQNADGGFPTFCKGWGKLPFDASCPDITAHAIRAILCWKNDLDNDFSKQLQKSLTKAINYLKKTQQPDGSWLPLWFGNEHDSNHQNPIYGTSLVVIGLIEALNQGLSNINGMLEDGCKFIASCKNPDGSWGGNKDLPGSIEETALALKALSLCKPNNQFNSSVEWLIIKTQQATPNAAPIGLYFASLWYDEQLYPVVHALGALNTLSLISKKQN